MFAFSKIKKINLNNFENLIYYDEYNNTEYYLIASHRDVIQSKG